MGNPSVSIGMPVFNGEQFLQQAIESVLAQEFEDFELIISDNASTDATADIAGEFARIDPRIRYSRLETNIGAAGNYNRVFRMAAGDYFKWAPHDDLIAPAFLGKCLEGFAAHGPSAIIVYPRSELIDADGRAITDDLSLRDMQSLSEFAARRTFRVLRAFGLVTSVLGLMRKAAVERTRLIGSFPSSDFAFLFEVAMLGKIAQIEDKLLFRRIHEKSSRRSNKSKQDAMAWFDPGARATRLSERHNLYLECLRSAARLEGVSLFDRATCAGSVLVRFALVDPRITLGRWRRRALASLGARRSAGVR